MAIDGIIEDPQNKELLATIYQKVRSSAVFSGAYMDSGPRPLEPSHFHTYRSKINKRLKKDLGYLAEDIEIASIGPNNYKRYGMRLSPKWIDIIGWKLKSGE